MDDSRPPITPDMKVAALLEAYPQLEARLMEVSPAFSKLKNPILRKTVAKVTTLRQAAVVGGVSLGSLLSELRQAAGTGDEVEEVHPDQARMTPVPSWLRDERVRSRADIRAMLEGGEKPLGKVLHDLSSVEPGEIYELTAPFVPAPLIEVGKAKGFDVWWQDTGNELVRVYFYRACSNPGSASELVRLDCP